MNDRAALIKKYAKDDDDRLTLAQTYDKLTACEGGGAVTSTLFLNEHQQELSEALIKDYGFTDYLLWGGYYGAGRRVAVFIPQWAMDEPESYAPLTCLRASWPKSVTTKLTHRDFLGAILGAGVKRDFVGDILPGDNFCDIIVLSSVKQLLLDNLVAAGRVNVHVEEIAPDEISPAMQEFKPIRDTVASLRLDSIVAAGFALAREKAAQLVKTGRVFVNDVEIDQPDRAVAAGDIISCRGHGKLRLASAGKPTRKGRVPVELLKYL